MSSSTYTQRWTSVNDLTTNHHSHNEQITSFFLQSTEPNTFTITLRPSQSLVSLIDPVALPSSSSSPSPPPVPPRPSEQAKRASPSRVADMVHRFESQSKSSTKTSLPLRNAFVKSSSEEQSSRISPIVIVERTARTTNPKRQPIIVCERITNHDRSDKSFSVVPLQTPLAKTCRQIPITTTTMSPQNVDSDTDSAIQTMPVLINKNMNDSMTFSRSNTTESNCSSSSSSVNVSTEKQQSDDQMVNHSTTPSLPIYSRPIPSTTSSHHEPSLSTRLCTSEINLVDQYHRLPSPDVSRSESNLSHNPNLPLKYKRESYCRLYGYRTLKSSNTFF